jgi:hypothetical protein
MILNLTFLLGVRRGEEKYGRVSGAVVTIAF